MFKVKKGEYPLKESHQFLQFKACFSCFTTEYAPQKSASIQ